MFLLLSWQWTWTIDAWWDHKNLPIIRSVTNAVIAEENFGQWSIHKESILPVLHFKFFNTDSLSVSVKKSKIRNSKTVPKIIKTGKKKTSESIFIDVSTHLFKIVLLLIFDFLISRSLSYEVLKKACVKLCDSFFLHYFCREMSRWW